MTAKKIHTHLSKTFSENRLLLSGKRTNGSNADHQQSKLHHFPRCHQDCRETRANKSKQKQMKGKVTKKENERKGKIDV